MQWLLADAHGGANPQADEEMVALLEMAVKEQVDLYILGDLFAVWLAPERFLTPYQRKVLSLFRDLKRCECKLPGIKREDFLMKCVRVSLVGLFRARSCSAISDGDIELINKLFD